MAFALDPHLTMSFCLTVAVIVVVPGPSVMFIIGRALAVGRPGAVAAAAGDSLGQTVQGVVAAFGIGAVVAESATLYHAITLAGAAYLVTMGATTLRQRHLAATCPAGSGDGSHRAELRRGFVVGASNPKTIVFFVAALPQFVDYSRGHVVPQMLALLAIYGVLGWAADTIWGVAGSSVRSWSATAPRRIERLVGAGGLCIIGVGAYMALSHGIG